MDQQYHDTLLLYRAFRGPPRYKTLALFFLSLVFPWRYCATLALLLTRVRSKVKRYTGTLLSVGHQDTFVVRGNSASLNPELSFGISRGDYNPEYAVVSGDHNETRGTHLVVSTLAFPVLLSLLHVMRTLG